MRRPKTISELRAEIRASPRLCSQTQAKLSRLIRVNQATISRILRGQFRRVSPTVARVCAYAGISRITDRPLGELEASMSHIASLPRGLTPRERQAMKLIRLAAEILESDPSGPVAPSHGTSHRVAS
mgnify:CR=1 FL=1